MELDGRCVSLPFISGCQLLFAVPLQGCKDRARSHEGIFSWKRSGLSRGCQASTLSSPKYPEIGFLLYMAFLSPQYTLITMIDIGPKNGFLEDQFPFEKPYFQGRC